MITAKTNDKVRVHYTGRLHSGEVFDSSLEREPLEFVIGSGQLIPGFDAGVLGMQVHEKKTISIPPDQAYGHRYEDLIQEINREQLPADIDPFEGQVLLANMPDGSSMRLIVTKVNPQSIVVDGNHPLAGEELIFDIELVEIL